MKNKQLAKIYYQNREVGYIDIAFSNLSHKIDIGPSTHISGSEDVTLDYSFTLPDTRDDDKNKESTISFWEIKNYSDKIRVDHVDSGIWIDWLSLEGNVKSSLFIPMERILHIDIDNPAYDYEQKNKKNEIEP